MLQWGHALSGMDTGIQFAQDQAGQVGFNGAMPFQAWIRATGKAKKAIPVALQWGHALSGMDTIPV